MGEYRFITLAALILSFAGVVRAEEASSPAESLALAPESDAVSLAMPSQAMCPLKPAITSPEPASTRGSGTVPYDPTSMYDQRGFHAPRGFAIEAPHEAIDPFSGNLLLTQTDLSLPGTGGLDLVLQRTYNSKIHRNYSLRATGDPNRIAIGMLFVPPSPVGLGWNLHLGRLVGAVSTARNDQLPGPRYFERGDGSQHTFFQYTGEGCGDEVNDVCLISKNRDNLYQIPPNDTWVVSTPDGLNTIFGHTAFDGFTLMHYATEIRDVHGNSIQISYHDNDIDIGGQTYIREYLRHFIDTIVDSSGRIINFNYNVVAGGEIRLASISVNGVSIQYVYATETPHNQAFLAEVRPPDGAAWHYAYAGLNNGECAANDQRWCELTQVTYPEGGTITYSFDDLVFWAQANPMSVRAVGQRDVAGRAVTPATWTYTYNRASTYAGDDHTVITRPDNSQEIFTYFGVGDGPYNPLGLAWKAGALLQKRILDGGGAVMETETYDWQPGPAISDEFWGDPFIGFDIGVFVPRLVRQTIQRGGLTWEVQHTSFHDSNDRPRCTTETGDGAVRYRLQAFAGPAQWQGDLLFRTPSLLGLEVLSYNAFSAAACDADQVAQVMVQPADEVDQRIHNSLGQVVSRIRNGRQTDYGYHGNGDVASETTYRAVDSGTGSPTDGVCARYDNYLHGVPRHVERGAAADCGVGLSSKTRTVDAFGRILSETNGRGHTTAFTYDDVGRLETIVPPGASGEVTVAITGDGGATTPATFRRITQGPYWLERRVDGFGREIEREVVSGVIYERQYDALGRTTFESLPSYAPGGTGDTFAYDALGRITGVTHADMTSRSFTYGTAAHTVTVLDEEQRQTVLTRRAYGRTDDYRLVRVQLPGETAPTSDTYEYLVGGHLSRVNYGGRQRVINYDLAKNVVQEFSVETNNLFRGFDAAGNARCRDRGSSPDDCSNGNLDDLDAPVRYHIDRLGRVTNVYYADPATPDVTFEYDGADNITRMIDGVGTHDFTYTPTNRLEQRTSVIDGVTYITGYVYDNRGNLSRLDYPSGRQVFYDHDAANRVTTVRDGSTQYVHGVSYLPTGSPQSWTYGNGITTTVGLDARQRTDTMAAGGVYGLDYGYDGVGNVEALTESVTSYNGTFGYDSRNRLTSAGGPWGTLSYQYNPAGDRTRHILNGFTTFYNYDGFGQLASMTGTGGMNFGYDNFGNTTSRGVFLGESYEYTYDAENRMLDVVHYPAGGGLDLVVAYGYEGQGRRMFEDRFDPANSRVLHYDANGHRLAETNAAGDPVTDYIVFDGRTVAALDVRQVPGDTDCDRDVDFDDLTTMVGCFGGPGQPPPGGCDAADFDGDGDVDCEDDVLARAALPPCAFGDFDCNGFVDGTDITVLLSALRGPGASSPCVSFDADSDGDLDLGDFASLQQQLGQAPIPTKYWVADADGDWADPANWSGGTVPGLADVVGIDRAGGNYTITVSSGTNECQDIVSRERLEVVGGTLRVGGSIQVDNDFVLGNGIIEDATIRTGANGQSLIPGLVSETAGRLRNVTLLGDHSIPPGRAIRVDGQLVIDGSLTLDYSSSIGSTELHLPGGAVLSGPGTVVFAAECSNTFACRMLCDSCTLESGLTVTGESANITNSNPSAPWTNRATWLVNSPEGFNALMWLRGPFIHEGQVIATNGGEAQLSSAQIQPAGLVRAEAGSTATLDGAFHNDGLIDVDQGTVSFGGFFDSGPFTIDDIGQVQRNGGRVEIYGTIENAGQTIDLDASTGSWHLMGTGYRIRFGTVNGSGGARLIAVNGGNPYLRDVTLNVDMLADNAQFTFYDVSRFHGTLNVTPGTGGGTTTRLFLDSVFSFTDTVVFDGTGEVVFDDATLPDQNAVRYDSNAYAKLNIGAGLTLRTGTGSGMIAGQREVTNNAHIVADTPGTTIRLEAYDFINQGMIEAANGGNITTRAVSSPKRFINRGTVRAGRGSWFEDSSTTFPSREAAFVQDASGVLVIEIGGAAEPDRGRVTLGSPTFGGTLDIVLVDGYVPPIGTMIEVITWQSASTQFDQVAGMDLGNGTHFEAQYTATGLTLEVVPD